MTAAARPVLSGVSPSGILGDTNLLQIAALQTPRKSPTVADAWDFITAVAFDDLVGSGLFLAGPVNGLPAQPSFRAITQTDLPGGIDYVPFADGTVPAGNTVVNTAALTTFASVYSLPANFLTVGSVIRVRARGTLRTALGAVNFTFNVLYGATIMLTGTVAIPAGVVNAGFEIRGDLLPTVVGAGGTFEADGLLVTGNVSSGAAAGTPAGTQGIIGAMLVNIGTIAAATTVAKNIAIQVQMSVANANVNSVLRILTVDIARP